MRQGNHFTQRLDTDEYGAFVRVPLEIAEELEWADALLWISNGDGTFTLIPKS